MHPGCDIASDPASRLDRARQVLRRQLDALVGLAAVALRLVESIAPPRIGGDAGWSMGGIVALERAVRAHARVSWALRLIWALRAKLVGDLERVERGEGVDEVLAGQARPPLAEGPQDSGEDREGDPESELRAERAEAFGRETERLERESFGRYFSSRPGEAEFAEILKRPTEEVLALIREALGLDAAASEDAVVHEGGAGPQWPGLVPRAAAPTRAPPDPELRSPCPV